MQKIKVIVIAGPTASGKSDLAIELANRYNGEIVSADSLQIYRGLDIGTAKTPVNERQNIHHHLMDVRDITEDFSVADFIEEADDAIKKVVANDRLPIIVGGTGFYVKALLGFQSLDYGQSNSLEVKEDQKRELGDLVQELKKKADNDFLEKIDLNNKERVIRAIQIVKNGKIARTRRPEYQALVLGLDWSRDVLYQRINERVKKMIDLGLENEAKRLYNLGGLEIQAGRGIGYSEFYSYFKNEIDLKTVIEEIQKNSRRYAKRQLTYWRHQIPGLEWIPGDNALTIADEKVKKFIKD